MGGVFLSAWVGTTVLFLKRPTHPLRGDRIWSWLIEMGISTVLGALLVVMLLGVDLLLLAWRALPEGRRAFLSAAAAPIMIGLAQAAYPPGRQPTPTLFLIALLLPMVIVAFFVRWIGNARQVR